VIEIESIRIILLLVMLGIASYFDIRSRMIPDIIWLVFGGLGAILYVFDWNTVTSYHILTMIVTGAIALLLYLYKWTGTADVFALVSITIILPVYYEFVMVSITLLVGGFLLAGFLTLVDYIKQKYQHKKFMRPIQQPLILHIFTISILIFI